MAPKIAILFGHIKALALTEAKGVREAGGSYDIFQIAEVLSMEVLEKMHADPKDESLLVLNDPEQLEQYDAFLFGIPTRYGNFPAQWKTFWDKTGGIWQRGGYAGKYAGLFVATGTIGGGQETTAISALSTLVHHGIVFVPLGYKKTFGIFADVSQVRGGSPWGAGTFSGADGSRQPSPTELSVAKIQDRTFYQKVANTRRL